MSLGFSPAERRDLIAIVLAVAAAVVLPRCALDPTVSVYPLQLTESRPAFTNVVDMVEARDYEQALERRWTVQQKERPSPRELAALGHLEMASGRSDAARAHLTRALEGAVSRELVASISWDLSQAEFLASRYDESRRWAAHAVSHGLQVASWHLELLEALDGLKLQTTVEGRGDGLPLIAADARIPRVMTTVNGAEQVAAVIDSGAVFTIVSSSLAERGEIERLDKRGRLLGLLNESIPIEFGVIRSLEIGGLRVEDLLVAIMPDDSLSFFGSGNQPYSLDLLLGANVLRLLRIDLNFPRREVSLQPSPAHDGSPDQNVFFIDFRPVVQVSINRRGRYPFLLDTGSEISYLNQSLITTTEAGSREQRHGATLQGLGGSRKRGAQLVDVELATLGWAGAFRTIPTYASPESPMFGILGQNFLNHFRVIIDFGRMKLDLLQYR